MCIPCILFWKEDTNKNVQKHQIIYLHTADCYVTDYCSDNKELQEVFKGFEHLPTLAALRLSLKRSQVLKFPSPLQVNMQRASTPYCYSTMPLPASTHTKVLIWQRQRAEATASRDLTGHATGSGKPYMSVRISVSQKCFKHCTKGF